MAVKHGWYSPRQAKMVGSWSWKRENGEVITVSAVSPTATYECKWDDIVYLGEVIEVVEKLTEGILDYARRLPPDQLAEFMTPILEREKEYRTNGKRWN